MGSVLIAGGSGFIGSHLAERCLANHTVHVLVRPNTLLYRLRPFAERLIIHYAELGNQEQLDRCFAEAAPQTVFHLAARTRRRTGERLSDALDSVNEDLHNSLMLLSAASAANPPPKAFIRTGSLAEYGAGPAPFREIQREAPLTSYSAALVAGTHYVQMLQHRLPFPVITARLALVYGPKQSEEFFIPSLIKYCIKQHARRVPIELHRPNDRRDLLYVDDAVEALARLMTIPQPDQHVVNICTGVAPTNREIAELIATLTNFDLSFIHFAEQRDPEAIPDFRASPKVARNLMDWKSRVPFRQGVEHTVKWYQSNELTKD